MKNYKRAQRAKDSLSLSLCVSFSFPRLCNAALRGENRCRALAGLFAPPAVTIKLRRTPRARLKHPGYRKAARKRPHSRLRGAFARFIMDSRSCGI
jgi:hypothetical protein